MYRTSTIVQTINAQFHPLFDFSQMRAASAVTTPPDIYPSAPPDIKPPEPEPPFPEPQPPIPSPEPPMPDPTPPLPPEPTPAYPPVITW